MFFLIYRSRYGKDLITTKHETIEEVFDIVEYRQLSRRDYNQAWWITEPMERSETYTGSSGTHKIAFKAEEPEQEGEE